MTEIFLIKLQKVKKKDEKRMKIFICLNNTNSFYKI